MLIYFTTSTVSELVCLLFAILCLLKDTSIIWRSMILYLLITCVAELFGKFIAIKTHNNQWVYNIFLLFEGGFTHLMFSNLFRKYINSKPIIICGFALFLICYIAEMSHHGFFKYNNFTYFFMSILFVLYALYYYYLLLRDNDTIILKYSAEFWWVAGTLFFYFGNTVCNLFNSQLDTLQIFPNYQLAYLIFNVLNIILYGLWSYSFICRKWLATTSKN